MFTKHNTSFRHLVGTSSRHLKSKLWNKAKLRPLSETPNIAPQNMVFLAGMHRSGTSILHRILSEHCLVSGFSNTGVPQDEGQHLQTVYPAANQLGGPGRFAFNPQAYLNENSSLTTQHNREKLLREWGAYHDLKKEFFIEKSPPNLIRMRFLQALFPGAKFVIIVRHPIAVTLATLKWARTSPTELLLHWYFAHKSAMQDLNFLENWHLIRYEDLASNTPEVFDKLCKFIGIAPYAPKEAIIDHNQKYFQKWSTDFLEEEQLIGNGFLDMEGFLKELGYILSNPYATSAIQVPR